jgi:hypothetical protein
VHVSVLAIILSTIIVKTERSWEIVCCESECCLQQVGSLIFKMQAHRLGYINKRQINKHFQNKNFNDSKNSEKAHVF